VSGAIKTIELFKLHHLRALTIQTKSFMLKEKMNWVARFKKNKNGNHENERHL
jgi:hypothetical protein